MPLEELLDYTDHVYRTAARRVSWFARTFPTPSFYWKFFWVVYRASVKARKGKYGYDEWAQSSHEVLAALESVGVRAEFTGTENIRRLQSPCVFIANHMSMLETTVLPAVIQPIRNVTFVVKQSLLDYPIFRHVMRSRDPIAVTRDNPREDFKAVMEGGVERLNKGISIIVFPQTTRSDTFDPEQFNTIGVKLAARAKVPVVPIALLTDVWGNGKWIKDLGPIDPKRTVHFDFGEPIDVQGRGADEHQRIIEFIGARLKQWRGGGSDLLG
ncbi:MAG: 1-acyl-sn-glycerol-3-phosphate acyltransferase [Planctomycetaceae bacterium]|jgi:1-acyl-sn-glycerol-3-phosphate acyltransferase|nr:1-acyl-sn-glycerol-3-phosphate acyltransferase [Planctomycetaceae bacterium]